MTITVKIGYPLVPRFQRHQSLYTLLLYFQQHDTSPGLMIMDVQSLYFTWNYSEAVGSVQYTLMLKCVVLSTTWQIDMLSIVRFTSTIWGYEQKCKMRFDVTHRDHYQLSVLRCHVSLLTGPSFTCIYPRSQKCAPSWMLSNEVLENFRNINNSAFRW